MIESAYWWMNAHGKAVLSEVPEELLFSFLSGSKSAESLFWAVFTHIISKYKAFSFVSLFHLTLNTKYATVILIRPTGWG